MACQKHRSRSDYLPLKYRHAFAERVDRQRIEEELGPAPCPKCKYPLAVRLGREGPYFFCGCQKKRMKDEG